MAALGLVDLVARVRSRVYLGLVGVGAMSGGYIKPCGCDEDETCDVCHPPRHERLEEAKVARKYLETKAENVRLRTELERQYDIVNELSAKVDDVEVERDEAREAARTFFRLISQPTGGGSLVIGDAAVFSKWPWLSEQKA